VSAGLSEENCSGVTALEAGQIICEKPETKSTRHIFTIETVACQQTLPSAQMEGEIMSPRLQLEYLKK
jgi:hypothetical protein